jgi:hypothetical protein
MTIYKKLLNWVDTDDKNDIELSQQEVHQVIIIGR